MKIAHATNYLPYYHAIVGGGEQAVYRLVKLQAKKGNKISVLATAPIKKPKEDFKFFSVNVSEDYFDKSGSFVRALKLSFFPFDLVSFISSYKILKKIKPDILHLHNFNILSFSVLQAAKILDIPTVLSIYDYWYFCPISMLFDNDYNVCEKYHGLNCVDCIKQKSNMPRTLLKLFLLLRKPVFNYFLNKIDAFVALSESSETILTNYGIKKEKVHKIPLLFSSKDFKLWKPEKLKKNLILYAGWVVRHKGLHILVKAMPEILKEFPDAKLIAIGDNTIDKKYTNMILKEIKKHKLEKNVSLLGRLSDEDFNKFLGEGNIIVIPEQWENMSPVFLPQSMINGKPIVASNIGGIPEFLENNRNGLICKPNDPHDFAEKMIWMLKNKDSANKMGENAKKDISKVFNEDEISKNLTSLYNSLIKKN